MAIHPTVPTLLCWEEWPAPEGGLDLVLAVAVEMFTRTETRLRVYLGDSDLLLGTLETTCADPYQIFNLALPPGIIPQSGPLTIRLQMETDEPLWLFAPDPTAADGLEYHLPRLTARAAAPESFLARLDSLASLQTFGWKEGCVLDGLLALGRLEQMRRHLNYFGFESGDLIAETPRNNRVKNELGSIETTLPFAHVAALDIHHPWISLALDFWQQRIAQTGQIQDHEMISSEGAYTVAYPMTLIGARLGEDRWIRAAEDLLIETYSRLNQPDGAYLRHYQSDGRRTHRNWVRGIAWLLLGHVQTLRHSPAPAPRLREQFTQLAKVAADHQLEDGLWRCFMDEPGILPDFAGSAGVAAAFAWGARIGLLDPEFTERAERSRHTLHAQLTPEGFPTGCSQSNKADEDLLRHPYRVTTPYALGLLGLLEGGLAIED